MKISTSIELLDMRLAQEYKVCKLKGSIYGLKQSIITHVHKTMILFGFMMLEDEDCMYTKLSHKKVF